MNARDSENYLPISRSFSASKYCRDFLGRDISGTTLITGNSSRLLRIRFSADLTMYLLPVCHFRCMKFKPLVIWIWNQNIAISTIVGTSSHINSDIWTYIFFKVDRERYHTYSKEGANKGTQTQIFRRFKRFFAKTETCPLL
jgi:hypothetical protein